MPLEAVVAEVQYGFAPQARARERGSVKQVIRESGVKKEDPVAVDEMSNASPVVPPRRLSQSASSKQPLHEFNG